MSINILEGGGGGREYAVEGILIIIIISMWVYAQLGRGGYTHARPQRKGVAKFTKTQRLSNKKSECSPR